MGTPEHDEDGVVIEDDDAPQLGPVAPPVGSFAHMLGGLENGALNDALTKASREIVEAAGEYVEEGYGRGAAGEIVLKVKIGINDGEWAVKGEYKITKPLPPRRRTPMFMNRRGELSFYNEAQFALPLQTVRTTSKAAESVIRKGDSE